MNMSRVKQEECVCGILMGKLIDDWSLGIFRVPALSIGTY